MPVYFNGELVGGVDATALDDVPALLQPITGKDGYVVTLDNGDLVLAPSSGGGAPTGTGIVEVVSGSFTTPARTLTAVLNTILTARGDVFRRGATTTEALNAKAANTFLGGDGTDVAVRSASDVVTSTRAAIVTTPSLVSEGAGGWTPSAVVPNGTVTVTGGAIVTSIPNGSTTINAGGFELRAWPNYGDNVEIVARYTETGDASNAILALQFVEWASGSLYWALGAGGSWGLYSNLVGENTSVATRTGMPRDGTGWTKLRINGARVTAWTGIGVGSATPAQTAWSLLYDDERASLIGKSVPTMMEFGGRSSDTHAVSGATTISWSDIAITDLTQGA